MEARWQAVEQVGCRRRVGDANGQRWESAQLPRNEARRVRNGLWRRRTDAGADAGSPMPDAGCMPDICRGAYVVAHCSSLSRRRPFILAYSHTRILRTPRMLCCSAPNQSSLQWPQRPSPRWCGRLGSVCQASRRRIYAAVSLCDPLHIAPCVRIVTHCSRAYSSEALQDSVHGHQRAPESVAAGHDTAARPAILLYPPRTARSLSARRRALVPGPAPPPGCSV